MVTAHFVMQPTLPAAVLRRISLARHAVNKDGEEMPVRTGVMAGVHSRPEEQMNPILLIAQQEYAVFAVHQENQDILGQEIVQTITVGRRLNINVHRVVSLQIAQCGMTTPPAVIMRVEIAQGKRLMISPAVTANAVRRLPRVYIISEMVLPKTVRAYCAPMTVRRIAALGETKPPMVPPDTTSARCTGAET